VPRNPLAWLAGASGCVGNFQLHVTVKPRGVDHLSPAEIEAAIEACPTRVPSDFDFGLTERKAIYRPYEGCSPSMPAIDWNACTRCGKCLAAVNGKGISLDSVEKHLRIATGAVILATGFDLYQPHDGEFGHGRYSEVITLAQLERLLDPQGPTDGRLECQGRPVQNVCLIHCVGSRQIEGVAIHFGFLGYRVASGAWTMSRLVLGANSGRASIPAAIYLSELKTLVLHFLTQKRWRGCGTRHYGQWLQHLVLVSGYLTMLVLVVGLLGWFQTDEVYPLYHPQRWLGYYATVALVYGSVAMLLGRLRKPQQVHRFSHLSDWLFPGFILVGATTGILVHAFCYAGWPWPTYAAYLVHVMAMVAMLDVEVGVGKWMHLIYRPLAIYLLAVKHKAEQADATIPSSDVRQRAPA
jgi:ferredoxin